MHHIDNRCRCDLTTQAGYNTYQDRLALAKRSEWDRLQVAVQGAALPILGGSALHIGSQASSSHMGVDVNVTNMGAEEADLCGRPSYIDMSAEEVWGL